jgi:hypothetical protein
MRALLVSAAALLFCGCFSASGRRAVHYAGYRMLDKAPAQDCWKEAAYRACVYRSRAGRTDDGTLVWFFHYAEGDEGSFARIGLAHAFFAELARLDRPAPRVVSVSFGSHWLLSGETGKRQVVLTDDFAGPVLAQVEARVGVPRRRLAWGMSMGGWNAAELSLRKPELFSRVALSCPALYEADPFLAAAAAPRAEDGRNLWRHRFNGPAQWDADDPVSLARTAPARAAYLLQPNAADEFGFQGGAKALAAALGARASLAMAPDGHCLVNAAQAADFLSTQ